MAKCVDRTKVTSMVNIDIAGYGDTIMSGPTTGAGTIGFAPAILRTIHTPADIADELR